MIYLNNNTEVQEIFIPKQEITAPANPKPTYENGFEDGKKVGFNEGREYQKDQLLNLYVTENGEYEREDGWGVVTVDVPTEGGSDCSLGEGEIFLTTNDIGTYEMYASDEGYDGWSKFIVILEGGGAIYVHKASDLLEFFNNVGGAGIDYGAYYYVGGKITDITEVSTQYGNATYTLDNGFKVYRGKWVDGTTFTDENQIKVGAYIVVYGIIQNYKGTLQFKAGSQVIAYQENEGSEPIPPQDGWGMVGYFNSWGGTPDIPFEENGEWEGRPYKVIRGFEAVQGEFKIRRDNAWVNSYTANFYNEPQFAKLQKGDWNMPIDDGVWDIYLFFGDDGEPNEMLMLYADTDLYSIQYEYTLNVYTNVQNAIILIDSFYSGMTNEYFGGSASAPMKYGNTYVIRTIMEGYEPITERITCYNNEERYYTLTKIESGDCNIQDYKWVLPSMNDRAENGDIYIYPDDGFDAVGYIDLDPSVIYNEGVEEGRNQGIKIQDSKWVRPSMADRAENGDIYIYPDEGYDAVRYIDLDPNDIYNEGYEQGKAEGGEGGSCNLGTLDLTLTDPYTVVKDASEDGYDGYNQVIVRPDAIIAQQREEAINEFKNKMQEITITKNGTYSIDDVELQDSIAFDGNSYFDTGIIPTENIKIEVCIKVTNGNDSGMGGIIIGGGIDPVDFANYDGGENRGIAIGMGGGAIYGIWGATRSYNDPYKYEGEGTTTVVLQKNGGSWGWEGEKGSFGASTLYIGGYNRNGEEVEEKFTQSIVYIKIWTDGNDDSTMTLFRPKNMAQGGFGMVNSEGTEYNYVENIGDGTTTFVSEWVNIYPYGFKRVEVNVECVCPTAQEQAFEYDTTAFTYKLYGWSSADINRDNITNDCGDRPLDCLLLRNRNGECTVMTKFDNCSGTVRLESGWNGDAVILSLISNTITKFSTNAINSYHLQNIDTGFAQLEGNAIMNCNSLTNIKVTILNNDLSNQFATNCFNGLPTEGTITIKKNVDVTLTDDEITSFFRTIVGELWTITIE